MRNYMTTKQKTILTACGLTLIFSSCMTLNDNWVDLGDNYTFHADGKWKSIYPASGYFDTHIYSEVKDYKFDDKFIIAKQKPDYEHHLEFIESNYSVRFAIYSNFLKDSTSKTFIDETTPFIRKSIKADSSIYRILKSKGVTDQNKIDDQNKIKIILDSVFHKDPFYIRLFSSNENYWLIDKDKNIRYGPMTKQEFDNECRQQNIKLKLE